MLRCFSNMVGSNWMAAALYAVVDGMFNSSLAGTPVGARRPSHQKGFVDRGAEGVFRVHHIAETDPAALREKHVGIEFVVAEIGSHPADQLAIGDACGVFHRPAGADGHE